MKFNFKEIPDKVNQEFQLPKEGKYHLIITKAEFAVSNSGGLNINIETTIKGTNNKFITFNPLKNAEGNPYDFGLARLKRIFMAINKIPEMEIDLSQNSHRNMLISLLQAGEFVADIKHRTYKDSNGVDRTALEIADWDNLRSVNENVVEENKPLQVNEDIAVLVEDEDII